MFEFNDNNLIVEEFNGSSIYYIDNFYKDPDKVFDYINSHESILWKSWEKPSYNGQLFLDERHDFIDNEFTIVTNRLSLICNQKVDEENKIVTNKTKFIDYNFNDYFNNYWGPHRDLGYTGIIYFYDDKDAGTNLYEKVQEDIWNEPEHFSPWRSKSKYKLIKQIEAKFNRLVLFNGKKFLHGMNISNDRYFKEYRINQVIFFIER